MIGICRLCGTENVGLQDSHLMPKAFYKHILKSDDTPISATPEYAIQTSKQVSDYLLCTTCEDRFNKRGEKWVLENYSKPGGTFPIQEALSKASFYKKYDDSIYFNGSAVNGIQLDKLNYFAVSVFWRAAVHEWKFLNRAKRLSLGKYEEALRLYLLDKANFPENAVLNIIVSPSQKPQDGLIFPHTYRSNPFHCHGFSIPGIVFTLFVGNTIPKGLKDECAIHSNLLGLTELADDVALSAKKKLIAKNARKSLFSTG